MDNQHTKFEHIMSQLESLNPSIRLHKKEIERRLCKLSHTPEHPTYASMILKAISELNDQGGSSEEAISKFIETEYDGLPIAHASYVSHHLQKLITKGEIIYSSANYYLLPCEYSDSVNKVKRQKQLRKFRQSRLKGRLCKGVLSQQKQMIQEGQDCNQVREKISEGAEEQRIGLIGENKELGHAVLIEEPDDVEEAQYKMIEDEQYKEAEEHDLMQEQQNQQKMELNVHESQVEGNADKECHRARKIDEMTEIEIQEVQKDLATEEPCRSEQNSEKPRDSNLIGDPKSDAREEQVESASIQIETMAEEISLQEQCQAEINLQEQCQALCETIEGTADTQNQEEESHQARTSGEVTEKVVQEGIVIKEALPREQRSETPVESIPIRELESEGREAQAQVADLQIENTEEQQGQCFELICEEKKLKEVQMEVCQQIMDLSNLLVHFIKKKREDKATASTQYDTANLEDHFCSSHLRKEELMELLKKTYKIGAKLNDIMDVDVLELNNLKPMVGMKQKNSLENYPQQTKETCLQGSESLLVHDCQPQQHEICGQPEGSESQPKAILASKNIPSSLMGFEQNCQIELPTCKRPPEVEITVLEGLNRDQNKLVKLCDQQKALSTDQVKEWSTDHQQEITIRDVAIPPEFKLGQVQQPENLVEERPTQHEILQQQMQGQKLQEQLPPIRQMLSKAKVTTATSIAKQRFKTPDTQQFRKLRPRGPRPSKHEPLLTTVEADNDFTHAWLKAKLMQNSKASVNRRLQVQGTQTEVEISQSTEHAPLNRKRQQNHGNNAAGKISKHTEWQVNHYGQIKQLKSQPKTIITVDSANTCRQQTQEPSHSHSASVIVKSKEESLPLRNLLSEQVKQQYKRRGRPPKVKPDREGSMFLDHRKQKEEQQKKRAPQRPSKRKTNADASVEGSSKRAREKAC